MRNECFPGWTPVQVAKFYGFPMQATGKGQTIAIINLGQTVNMAELEKDFAFLRCPVPYIDIIEIDNAPASLGYSTETHLDIEVIGCICPDAKIKVYRCPLSIEGMANAISAAVKDNVDVISISWGGSEKVFIQEVEDALKAAHDAHITVCVATGDFGSSQRKNQAGHPAPAPDGLAHCGYPASSPWVLACGGTQLNIDSLHNKTEVVWNNSPAEHQAVVGGATGGGVSHLFDLPTWQKSAKIKISNVNYKNNTQSAKQYGRVIPDVSGLAAAGDWKIALNGTTNLIGGTSAIAPMWSAFIAQINQLRAEQKPTKHRLGFINKALYQLQNKQDYFNDITRGTNRVMTDYPGYDAQTGFDACSGWGSPKANALSTYFVTKHP